MRLIQIVLVLGFVASLAAYLAYFRSLFRDRLIALLVFAAAVTAILVPELTVVAAKVLGVGRGTDLVLYAFVCATVFGAILMYSKIAKTERTLTELVRHMAIASAEEPAEPERGQG